MLPCFWIITKGYENSWNSVGDWRHKGKLEETWENQAASCTLINNSCFELALVFSIFSLVTFLSTKYFLRHSKILTYMIVMYIYEKEKNCLQKKEKESERRVIEMETRHNIFLTAQPVYIWSCQVVCFPCLLFFLWTVFVFLVCIFNRLKNRIWTG